MFKLAKLMDLTKNIKVILNTYNTKLYKIFFFHQFIHSLIQCSY